MTTKEKRPNGRPTIYNEELAALICERVATHIEGTTKLCEMYDDMPHVDTILQWRFKYPDFSSKYLESKRFQSELLAESIDEVLQERHVYYDDKGNERIDTGAVARAVAIANGRKWTASRLAPRIYGDKKFDDLQADNERVKQELQEVKDRLDRDNVKEY